jgi:Flp pilus assembly protein TadD
VLATPDPGAAKRRSRRLALASALIVLAFAAGLVFLWYSGSSGSSPGSAGGAPSPAGIASSLEPAFLEWTSAVGGSPEELRATLQRHVAAAKQDPKDAEALSSLGRVQLELGSVSDAIASFQGAAEAAPHSSAHRFHLAWAQCSLARWDECITTLRDAQRLAPDDMAIRYNLGVALHRRGVDDVAVVEYGKAQELSGTEPAVRLGLAISYDKLGRSKEAVEAYKDFLRLQPSGPRSAAVRARVAELGG